MSMKKKVLIILVGLLVLASCGEDGGEEDLKLGQPQQVQDSIPTLSGEFIFLSDAAVLKGRNFIYGVQMDSVARELVKKVEPLKRDEFDMIPVTVKGKIIPNPQRNGWEEIIQIQEVLKLPDAQEGSATDTLNQN